MLRNARSLSLTIGDTGKRSIVGDPANGENLSAKTNGAAMSRGRKRSVSGLADEGKGGGLAAMVPPLDMTPPAMQKWRAIVPLIAELCALRETDADALRQYCEMSVLAAKASAELEGQSLTLVTPNGAMQVNPLLKVISQANSVLMKLSERFGLDPASRKRLQLATKQSSSPLLDYLKRGSNRKAGPTIAK
jgi:P27 family predicted phage terminase small subunit